MNTVLRHRALSLGNLRAFEAVARRLNFSEAAEELHVTQSAISRQIKGLEDELGAPLFTRGTRHVELTSSGTSNPEAYDLYLRGRFLLQRRGPHVQQAVEKFAQAIKLDPLKTPGDEINQAVDEALKKYPFIDGSRMCAAGASYGFCRRRATASTMTSR